MTTDPESEEIIEAGGKRYRLYFGNRAFRLIERQLGKPILELNANSMDELTTVIWAGFQQHHGDELTLIEDVDTIIDEIGYTRIGELVEAAIQRALPPKTTAGAEKGPALGNGNGTGAPTSPQRSRPASPTRNSGG